VHDRNRKMKEAAAASRMMPPRRLPGLDFFSDNEDYEGVGGEPYSGRGLPKPIHIRGSSADSTLTGDSSLMQQARAMQHQHQVRTFHSLVNEANFEHNSFDCQTK
jgi:hypothetical protein